MKDIRIVEWMEREDKGLGVLLGIECGVNDKVMDGVFGTSMEEKRDVASYLSVTVKRVVLQSGWKSV